MNQRSISSYLPIIYILTIVLCISIIHVSEMINAHYHKIELKKLESSKKVFKKQNKRKKPTSKKKNKQVQKIDTLAKVPEKLIAKVDTVSKEPITISDSDFFENLLSKYNSKSGNANANSQSRTDIVIRYYKKSKDKDRVYQLRNLGLYIHERSVEDDFDDYASNAIFYGDSVKKEDLVMIAYNLMKSGVKLQSITLSKYHDAWKAHSVEIGTDTTALNKEPITLATLRKEWASM